MIGQKHIKQITDLVMKMSKAHEMEVLVVVSNSALTRFANNMVHQNVASSDVAISVRSIFGKKVGVSSSNIQVQSAKCKDQNQVKSSKLTIDTELRKQLNSLVKKSEEIARATSEDEEFVGLPKPDEKTSNPEPEQARFRAGTETLKKLKTLKSVYDSTVNFSAKQRVEAVGRIIEKAEKAGLVAFGSLQTGLTEYCIANSHGVFGYHPVSTASMNIRVMQNDVLSQRVNPSKGINPNETQNEKRSGYAGFISTNVSDIDFDKLADQAIHKATFSEKQIEIEPGEYEVILEEPAVAEMMQFLAYLGFGAKNFHEGSSFVSGRLGEKILGENVTIHDDPFHPLTITIPFDFEGMSKNKLPLINKGVAENIVYDYQSGKKHKMKPTGHGLPAPNTEGPLPLHLTMEPGTTPRSELIKKVKKGILVTRFWYVNPIHPKLLNITGMTRDGTFYIENGEIKGAIRNLRFTQSIPEALSNVIDIAAEVKAEEGWGGATVVPAVHVGKFNFTGTSKL